MDKSYEPLQTVEEPGTAKPSGPAPLTPVAAPAAPARRPSPWPMWVLALVIMIDQVDQNIVRGIETPLKKDVHLHMTDFKFGVLLAAFIAVNGIVTVPAGYLADRWHRTRTVGHTVVAWSGITALTAASPNFGVLLGIRSALGFGQAVTEPSCASLLADYYPAEQRGRAFSIQQCLVFLGFGLGLGLGGFVGNTLGWRAAFLIVGTPGVLIALAVYRLAEPRRGAADRIHLGLEELAEGEGEHRPPPDRGGLRQVRAGHAHRPAGRPPHHLGHHDHEVRAGRSLGPPLYDHRRGGGAAAVLRAHAARGE